MPYRRTAQRIVPSRLLPYDFRGSETAVRVPTELWDQDPAPPIRHPLPEPFKCRIPSVRRPPPSPCTCRPRPC